MYYQDKGSQLNDQLVLKEELEKGLNAFSVKPIGDYCGQTKVSYGFTKEKNNAKKYIFSNTLSCA